jgi:hypothetical protein
MLALCGARESTWGRRRAYSEVVRTILDARPRIGAIHALRLSQRFEPRARVGRRSCHRRRWHHLHTGVHSFDLMRFLSGMDGSR